jgi:hypothetical protein
MNPSRIIVSVLCALLASVLGHAQASTTPSSQTRPPQQPAVSPPASTSSSGSSTSNQPFDARRQDVPPNDRERRQWEATSTSTRSTGVQANVTTTTEIEPQVRTTIQEIDAEGPVVIDRISTRFADVTCTEENAHALVVALHDGTSVTLRGDNGQVATFTPIGRLGYGEAYIAMSLAVETLHQAGISGCATPAQWQAVLLGGELSGGTRTTTTITTERFPGILVLRQREGGWAQVAQTTHVELGPVVSQAHTTLQLKSSTNTSTDANQQKSLTPTGRSSDYNPRGDTGTNAKSSSSTTQKNASSSQSSTEANKAKDSTESNKTQPAAPGAQQPGDKSPTPTGHSSDYNPRQQDQNASKSGATRGNSTDMGKKNEQGSASEQRTNPDQSKNIDQSKGNAQDKNSLTPTGHSSDYNPRQQDSSSSSDKSKADASSNKDKSNKSTNGQETEEEKKKRERGY